MFRSQHWQLLINLFGIAGPSLEGVSSIRYVSQVVADLLIPFMSEGDS